MTRRSDNGLRSAISVLERMLLTDPSTDAVLMRSVTQLMALLEASFGYVYRCRESDSDSIPWELTGCFESIDGDLVVKKNSSTSDHIPADIQARLLSGRCIRFDNGEYPHPLPHNHPKIDSAFCIPLVDARRIYGVIYLCNAENGFDDSLENRVRPFIAAASCLLRASHGKQHFQFGPETRELTTASSPESLQSMLDTMFNGVLILDSFDAIRVCNGAAASMFGLPRRELIGETLSRFLPKGAPKLEGRLTGGEKSDTALAARKTVWRGVPAKGADGEKILADVSSFELDFGGQKYKGVVLDDISERMKSSADYHSTLQRFQALTNIVPVAIVQLSRDWECTYANDSWCEYTQMTPDEAHGIGWLNGLHLADADKTLNELRTETSLTGSYEGEFRLQSPLGNITWVKATASCLYAENGEISGMIMTFNDITEHLKNETRLRDIAEKDQLTGLINRAFFNDRLDIALKGVKRFGAVALMFIDLDEFKHVNDTIGHDAGDSLLREVANRLGDSVRQVDTIARIGGDEFTVILTNVQNTRSITAIADKLLESLAEPIIVNNRPMYVSCSIGIAVAETDGSDTKQLLKQADAALYKAKDAGKNQYKFYTAELDRNASLHMLLQQSLKDRSRNDFRLVYQPQVDAATNKIIGVEALTRWSHDDADPIGPDVFIKIIEESGLINEFSEWLLEEVFSTVSAWRKTGNLDVLVSINISAKQFRNKDLAMLIYQRSLAHGVDPKSIVLEITETAIIDDPEIATNTLKSLRSMGFGLALDDFGTGYSSLMYLRQMPLQCVKIDRSFVKDVIHDEEDAKIVFAILGLAKTLGMDVVAEGVDNTDVKNWLIDHDCRVQQGFHFHKPLERADIEQALELEGGSPKVLPFNKRLS